jgi:hypothetical protein
MKCTSVGAAPDRDILRLDMAAATSGDEHVDGLGADREAVHVGVLGRVVAEPEDHEPAALALVGPVSPVSVTGRCQKSSTPPAVAPAG